MQMMENYTFSATASFANDIARGYFIMKRFFYLVIFLSDLFIYLTGVCYIVQTDFEPTVWPRMSSNS